MSRDIEDRLRLFVRHHVGWKVQSIDVRRLALNMDQVLAFNPPPNPAKTTDARYQSYADQFGEESWELDALDPTTIDGLIEAAIREHRDEGLWREMIAHEDEEKSQLYAVANNWSAVSEFLRGEQTPEDEA